MRHIGGQCHCALFSEVRILGDATFTQKPKIANQNGERGTVAACDVRARGQNLSEVAYCSNEFALPVLGYLVLS